MSSTDRVLVLGNTKNNLVSGRGGARVVKIDHSTLKFSQIFFEDVTFDVDLSLIDLILTKFLLTLNLISPLPHNFTSTVISRIPLVYATILLLDGGDLPVILYAGAIKDVKIDCLITIKAFI